MVQRWFAVLVASAWFTGCVRSAAPGAVQRVHPRIAQDFDAPHVAEADAESHEYQTYRYIERAGTALRLYVFRPSPGVRPSAAVLLFHSGGWTRGRPEWLFGLAKQFSGLGLVAIPVQYRLSKDGLTPLDALADACAAFRWVRQHAAELKVDPNQVAGWGASAGGHLVATAATAGCPETGEEEFSGAPNALLLVSGGIDPERSIQFRKLIGETVDVSRYSPLRNVKPEGPPTLLITGVEDSVTRQASAEAFCEAVRSTGTLCVLVSFPRLGHLLTRRLDDQRSSLDPDPQAEQEAYVVQEHFLRSIGFVSAAAPAEP
ncbi:MAG: alpha/beta hydrolase [Myxococcales bacterium]